MAIEVSLRQQVLGLFARWGEHRDDARRWEALLALLELRELLRQSPAAASALPAGFDPERELRAGAGPAAG